MFPWLGDFKHPKFICLLCRRDSKEKIRASCHSKTSANCPALNSPQTPPTLNPPKAGAEGCWVTVDRAICPQRAMYSWRGGIHIWLCSSTCDTYAGHQGQEGTGRITTIAWGRESCAQGSRTAEKSGGHSPGINGKKNGTGVQKKKTRPWDIPTLKWKFLRFKTAAILIIVILGDHWWGKKVRWRVSQSAQSIKQKFYAECKQSIFSQFVQVVSWTKFCPKSFDHFLLLFQLLHPQMGAINSRLNVPNKILEGILKKPIVPRELFTQNTVEKNKWFLKTK